MTAPTGTAAPRRRMTQTRWLVAGGGFALVCLLGLIPTIRDQSIFRHPVVRVGFNRFPPYVDKDPSGKPAGFAVEILTQAARLAKVDLRWVEIAGSADDAFAQGKADMYPLMTITPAREARFHMSAPWWENQFSLISTEGHEIPNAAAIDGKRIGTRIGVIKTLSQKLFPGARFFDMATLEEMEAALCNHDIDGFFADDRLMNAQLMRRSSVCAGQPIHAMSIPETKLLLGTASTKAAAEAGDRIFHEIARSALDGTLSREASKWGVFTPFDAARLKRVVDAETRETQMAWALAVALLILTVNVVQTRMIRRARHDAESAQAETKQMQNRFDEFMKHTPTITFIKDEKGRVVYSNEEFCLKRRPELADENSGREGGLISERLSRKDEEILVSGMGAEVTETLRGEDGVDRYFLVAKFPFSGIAGSKLLGGVALDVTTRIVAEKELERQAKHDLLTGLPNRRHFIAELDAALRECDALGVRLVVGFIDLDGFKQVNDLMGHEAGDDLLRQVSARLKRVCAEESDLVARLGGDEFTLFSRVPDFAAAERKMRVALNAIEEPFFIGEREVFVSASIGLSLFPAHGEDSHQLLKRADSAMYTAKIAGKSRIHRWLPAPEEIGVNSPDASAGLRILSGVR